MNTKKTRENYRLCDTDYREYTIASVRDTTLPEDDVPQGYDIDTTDRCIIYCPPCHPAPCVGDVLRVYYGPHINSLRGLMLNDRVIYYRTHDEQFAFLAEEAESKRAKKLQHLEQTKSQRDALYNALPDAFKRRIDFFRQNTQKFDAEIEEYELFCCTEAVKIYERFKDDDLAVERIECFAQDTMENMQTLLPTLSYDEHSDNSFGCAVYLATLYATHPERLVYAHGSLCPKIGCEEVGCWSDREFSKQRKGS